MQWIGDARPCVLLLGRAERICTRCASMEAAGHLALIDHVGDRPARNACTQTRVCAECTTPASKVPMSHRSFRAFISEGGSFPPRIGRRCAGARSEYDMESEESPSAKGWARSPGMNPSWTNPPSSTMPWSTWCDHLSRNDFRYYRRDAGEINGRRVPPERREPSR